MSNYRIGQGFDLHRLDKNLPFILGGIKFDFDLGFVAHSDGDVLIHAIIDSLLGALALGDIGALFPDTDEQYKNADSVELLKKVLNLIKEKNYKIVNLDTTIKAQKPKMRNKIDEIRNNLAKIMEIDVDKISVKAKTMEGLGFIGEVKAVAVDAVVLLEKV